MEGRAAPAEQHRRATRVGSHFGELEQGAQFSQLPSHPQQQEQQPTQQQHLLQQVQVPQEQPQQHPQQQKRHAPTQYLQQQQLHAQHQPLQLHLQQQRPHPQQHLHKHPLQQSQQHLHQQQPLQQQQQQPLQQQRPLQQQHQQQQQPVEPHTHQQHVLQQYAQGGGCLNPQYATQQPYQKQQVSVQPSLQPHYQQQQQRAVQPPQLQQTFLQRQQQQSLHRPRHQLLDPQQPSHEPLQPLFVLQQQQRTEQHHLQQSVRHQPTQQQHHTQQQQYPQHQQKHLQQQNLQQPQRQHLHPQQAGEQPTHHSQQRQADQQHEQHQQRPEEHLQRQQQEEQLQPGRVEELHEARFFGNRCERTVAPAAATLIEERAVRASKDQLLSHTEGTSWSFDCASTARVGSSPASLPANPAADSSKNPSAAVSRQTSAAFSGTASKVSATPTAVTALDTSPVPSAGRASPAAARVVEVPAFAGSVSFAPEQKTSAAATISAAVPAASCSATAAAAQSAAGGTEQAARPAAAVGHYEAGCGVLAATGVATLLASSNIDAGGAAAFVRAAPGVVEGSALSHGTAAAAGTGECLVGAAARVLSSGAAAAAAASPGTAAPGEAVDVVADVEKTEKTAPTAASSVLPNKEVDAGELGDKGRIPGAAAAAGACEEEDDVLLDVEKTDAAAAGGAAQSRGLLHTLVRCPAAERRQREERLLQPLTKQQRRQFTARLSASARALQRWVDCVRSKAGNTRAAAVETDPQDSTAAAAGAAAIEQLRETLLLLPPVSLFAGLKPLNVYNRAGTPSAGSGSAESAATEDADDEGDIHFHALPTETAPAADPEVSGYVQMHAASQTNHMDETSVECVFWEHSPLMAEKAKTTPSSPRAPAWTSPAAASRGRPSDAAAAAAAERRYRVAEECLSDVSTEEDTLLDEVFPFGPADAYSILYTGSVDSEKAEEIVACLTSRRDRNQSHDSLGVAVSACNVRRPNTSKTSGSSRNSSKKTSGGDGFAGLNTQLLQRHSRDGTPAAPESNGIEEVSFPQTAFPLSSESAIAVREALLAQKRWLPWQLPPGLDEAHAAAWIREHLRLQRCAAREWRSLRLWTLEHAAAAAPLTADSAFDDTAGASTNMADSVLRAAAATAVPPPAALAASGCGEVDGSRCGVRSGEGEGLGTTFTPASKAELQWLRQERLQTWRRMERKRRNLQDLLLEDSKKRQLATQQHLLREVLTAKRRRQDSLFFVVA